MADHLTDARTALLVAYEATIAAETSGVDAWRTEPVRAAIKVALDRLDEATSEVSL